MSVGLLFAIVGVIGMLSNMSDPDAIGPAFAIACIRWFDSEVLSELQGFISVRRFDHHICAVLTGVSVFVLRLSGADNQRLIGTNLRPIGSLVLLWDWLGTIANVGNSKGVGPAMVMALLGLGYACFIPASLVFLIPIPVLPEPSNMQDSLLYGLGLAGLFLSLAALFISFS